jgi:[ribosomal protein S18]-alanine N-acetyltransferase
MGITYFKRLRMEYDLSGALFNEPPLGEGYELLPWSEDLLRAHAEVKYKSFRFEIDANVFPNLGARDGCRRLMDDIVHRGRFVPEATWLVQYWPQQARKPEICGTIQGMVEEDAGGVRLGAVQNVGVTESHRGRGLGSALLHRSLLGFRQAGFSRVYLEVTAQNSGAVRLYSRLGFRQTKVVFKAAEVLDEELMYA